MEVGAACFGSLRSSSIVAVVMMSCKSCRIGPLSVNSFLVSTSCIITAVVSQSNVRKYNTLIVDKDSECSFVDGNTTVDQFQCKIQMPDGY